MTAVPETPEPSSESPTVGRIGFSRRERIDLAVFGLLLGVVLPLAPDVDFALYGSLNPQRLVRVVVVIAGVGLLGALAQRLLGARIGLVAAGFASGFVSSSATIAAYGIRARDEPDLHRAAVAGALSSSVATVVLYGLLVVAIDPALLPNIGPVVAFGCVTSVASVAWFVRKAPRVPADPPTGLLVRWGMVLMVAAGTVGLTIAAAWLREKLGNQSVVMLSFVSGFVDAHATTATLASMHHDARISADVAKLAILVALSSNSITKIAMARAGGGFRYARDVALGVVAIAASVWLGSLVPG